MGHLGTLTSARCNPGFTRRTVTSLLNHPSLTHVPPSPSPESSQPSLVPCARYLDSTRGFSQYWVNDRTLARRPWVHQPAFKKLDALCATHPPPKTLLNRCEHRCLEVEYAICIVRAKREAEARTCRLAQAAFRTWATAANGGGNADAGLCNTDTDADPTLPVTATQGGDWAGRMLPQADVTDYVLGFGSLINTASRMASDPNAMVAIPVRMSSKVGYARAWNFQHPIAQITALGIEKTGPGSTARSINGVVTPVLTTYAQNTTLATCPLPPSRRSSGPHVVPPPPFWGDMRCVAGGGGRRSAVVSLPPAPLTFAYGLPPPSPCHAHPGICGHAIVNSCKAREWARLTNASVGTATSTSFWTSLEIQSSC